MFGPNAVKICNALLISTWNMANVFTDLRRYELSPASSGDHPLRMTTSASSRRVGDHVLKKIKVRRRFTANKHGLPLRNPVAHKSLRRTDQWIAAASCRRSSLSGPSSAWTPYGFHMYGVPLSLWELLEIGQILHQTLFRGSTPYFSSTSSPDVYPTRGYFC